MINAIIKIIFVVVWILFFFLLLTAIQLVIRKRDGNKFFGRVQRLAFWGVCFIMGLRIKQVGEIEKKRPLLLVSNHLSYLDVLVIGSRVDVCFTPKSEIEGWPMIGAICRLIGCVFIERKASKVKDSESKLKKALAERRAVSVFAEGTTGDGKHLHRFKSSLFVVAEDKLADMSIYVQPLAIRYLRVGGLPIDSVQLPRIAWYGDMYLAPHLWQLLQLGKIDVELDFMPAIAGNSIGERKEIADYCYRLIDDAIHG